MRLLLDTHIFLWFISADNRLDSRWRETIQRPENEVSLSIVSLWETIVKYQLGKLPLPHPPHDYIPEQRARHQIHSLALDEESVKQLSTLSAIHRDPFDRMLICQALEHGLTLVTVDRVFRDYAITLWQ